MATTATPQPTAKEVKTDHVRKALVGGAVCVTVLAGAILLFGAMRGGDQPAEADLGRRPAPTAPPAAGSYQQRLEQYRARAPQEEQQVATPKQEAAPERSPQEMEWVRQQLLKNMAVNEAPPDRRGAARLPPPPAAAPPAPQSALAPAPPPASQGDYDALAERITQLRAQRAAQTGAQP